MVIWIVFGFFLSTVVSLPPAKIQRNIRPYMQRPPMPSMTYCTCFFLTISRFLLKGEPRKSVNVEDNDGDTPLFFCDDVATAKILVDEFHADTKHKNHEGKTAAENALINGSDNLAAYLSSVTGEKLESRSALLARFGEEDDDEGNAFGQPEATEGRLEEIDDDPVTEDRVDEIMERVETILKRADETGADPTEELRELVGASIMRQIMEGYGK